MRFGRHFWAYVLLVLYASLASASTLESGAFVGLGFSVVLVALLVLASRALRGRDRDDAEDAQRAAGRAAIAFALASLPFSAGARTPGMAALSALILGVATALAIVVLARTEGKKTLLAPPASATSPDAAIIAAFVATVAFALPMMVVLDPDAARFATDARIDVAAVAAATLALLLLAYCAARNLRARRHELGLFERSTAALLSAVVSFFVAIASVLAAGVAAERALPTAAACASIAVVLAACAPSEAHVDAARKLVFAIVVVLAPVALGLALLARRFPDRAAVLVLAATLAGALLTLVVRLRNRPPPLVTALAQSLEDLRAREPDAAVGSALAALRAQMPDETYGAAIYLSDPAEMIYADRTGATLNEPAGFPERAFLVAQDEPWRVVRRAILEVAQVRRPEVRDLAGWMSARGFAYLAPLYEGDTAIGLLALAAPKSQGTESTRPPRLEEIRAMRVLADQFSTVVVALARIKRSERREVEIHRSLEEISKREVAALTTAEASVSADLLRHLAKRAEANTFSASARLAVDRIQTLARTGRAITLLTAPGIDDLAWVALFHRHGEDHEARGLVVVDGADATFADLELWRDRGRSPLFRAGKGTLAILFPDELPKLVQAYIGVELEAARALGPRLVAVVSRTADTLVATGKLDERLALLLDDRLVALPTLDQRPEDLRGIVLDHLATIGRRFFGEVARIDPRAFALLTERELPGNDAELFGILCRALTLSRGGTIEKAHLARALADAQEPVESPARASRRLQ